MQICRYKLENNTLNSVLDCDSNKIITKKIGWKGPKLYSAKGTTFNRDTYVVYIVRVYRYDMASLHCSSMSIVYILWLFYIVQVYSIFQEDFFVVFSYFYCKYSRSALI
jgi:hypothetical protein